MTDFENFKSLRRMTCKESEFNSKYHLIKFFIYKFVIASVSVSE
jgi:hypothetical protein